MYRQPIRAQYLRRAFALAVALLFPAVVLAHSPQPTHACTQPVRPPDKNDADVWNRFVDQVDAYRDCMSTFITQNNEAADRHRAAANSATEEWNAFVHGSLNVPEDFPWPLPDKESN